MNKPREQQHIRRCAIYTRKSSEEGLDQAFNSLDAQREACEAYIKSQAGEGWKAVRTAYDDGGISGGTLDRSALQMLLADIQAGKIDTVVVYKVDRLTRSLGDFAKIMDVFDGNGVSFVSVTQQFNTTSSMGRLTLNMLLSFAQFEREVTGERIRDKIAASKKKGMWMGGFVPLGYEPDGRTLTINATEAATVQIIFTLYLEHGTVRAVKEEADRRGFVTKMRKSTDGKTRGGRPLSRGYIYKLLNNPLYIGRIPHKGETYEGQHPAIIDMDTWDAVQQKLANNRHERRAAGNLKKPSLLAGKLFDATGARLTPSHAVKSGRRYRYYVSQQLVTGTAKMPDNQTTSNWRLPAREIERIVGSTASALLADRAALSHAAREAGIPAEIIGRLLEAVATRDGGALDLVDRVELDVDKLSLVIGVGDLIGQQPTQIRYSAPMRLKRRGIEMRLVLEDNATETNQRNADPVLIRAIARAHVWFDDLTAGRAVSIKAIAKAEGVTDRHISKLLPLAFLAPDIVETILAGNQPAEISAETLIKHMDLPLDWGEQRSLLDIV